MNKKSIFETLSSINVNNKVEKKGRLTYLSWSYAWGEVKKTYENANYSVIKNEETNLPYFYDESLGFMCYTEVTINNECLEMWLPVLDSNNKAMKKEAYVIKTYSGNKTIQPATMFDINKTIMRCLAKNLAMFGLGHYLYAGEDLPEQLIDEVVVVEKKKEIKQNAKEKTPELYTLEIGTAKFDAVLEFISSNKDKGLRHIVSKLKSKILDDVVVKKIKDKKDESVKVNIFVKNQLTKLNSK